MNSYTAENTLVLAKRHHNTKRTYLLVNPLQAKHLPVSPARSLKMMTCLGESVAKKYPSAKLVIGFAETATAIGAAVAGCLDPGCQYIHTTREPYGELSDWIYFNEEHSHAVEQKLYSKNLGKWIEETPEIIFVDDEISTGKTLMNIIDKLCEAFPQAKSKPLIAASIINRLSEENEKRFSNAGIESQYLVKVSGNDLSDAVAHFDIQPPKSPDPSSGLPDYKLIHTDEPFMNPRLGVSITKYTDSCREQANRLCEKLLPDIQKGAEVLVLGTEECMYPSLALGQELERSNIPASVRCHATTRSPIGICLDEAYPIRSGFKLRGFFDNERETYIYNLAPRDTTIVVTDTAEDDQKARADLSRALSISGCSRIIFVEGGSRV